jgi:hypothetical protein
MKLGMTCVVRDVYALASLTDCCALSESRERENLKIRWEHERSNCSTDYAVGIEPCRHGTVKQNNHASRENRSHTQRKDVRMSNNCLTLIRMLRASRAARSRALVE